MKTWIFAAVLSCLTVPAFAEGTVYHFNCNLSDLSKPLDQANIVTKSLDLKTDDDVTIAEYAGDTYAIAAFNMVGPGAPSPQEEILLSAKNGATKKILSAIVTFAHEIPDIILQNGDVLLRCAP